MSSIPFCNFSFKSFLLFIIILSGASVSTYDIFKYSIKFITWFVSSSGKVSISLYKDKNFIEALAVDEKCRRKGYGKILLEKAIKELGKPVYTISKVDEFYLKNGFVYDNADLIDKECKTCEEYNVTCFPKVVVYK